MHLVPAPAVSLMKRRVLSRPGPASMVYSKGPLHASFSIHIKISFTTKENTEGNERLSRIHAENISLSHIKKRR